MESRQTGKRRLDHFQNRVSGFSRARNIGMLRFIYPQVSIRIVVRLQQESGAVSARVPSITTLYVPGVLEMAYAIAEEVGQVAGIPSDEDALNFALLHPPPNNTPGDSA